MRDELVSYPGADARHAHDLAAGELATPLRLRHAGGELSFISTVTTFGTAVEVTLSELAIEAFFPANAVTAEALRAAAAAGASRTA